MVTLYLALFAASLTSWPMPLAYLAATLIIAGGWYGETALAASPGRHRSPR